VYVCVQDGSPQQADSVQADTVVQANSVVQADTVVQADSVVKRLCCETAVRDSVVKRLFEEGAQKLLEKRRFCSCRDCCCACSFFFFKLISTTCLGVERGVQVEIKSCWVWREGFKLKSNLVAPYVIGL